jgi:hypothetical protein
VHTEAPHSLRRSCRPRLALETMNAVLRYKERPQRPVRVIRHKPPPPPIELLAPAGWPFYLKHILPRVRIPQLLRQMQVLLDRDLAEVLPMPRVMFLQQMLRAKPRTPAPCRRSQHQRENKAPKRSIAGQRSCPESFYTQPAESRPCCATEFCSGRAGRK